MKLFHSEDVSCVTASQVVRLITPHVHDNIHDDDIIITGDIHHYSDPDDDYYLL